MRMIEQTEKIKLLSDLEDQRLASNRILSEWVEYLLRNAEVAFVANAYLAALITTLAALEAYLRDEYASSRNENLASLVSKAPIDDELKGELERLRCYRNRWIHVEEPWNDYELIVEPVRHEQEMEDMAILALRSFSKSVCEV